MKIKKDNTKVLKRALKYTLFDKKTNKVVIHRYKTKVSEIIGVSIRTLDREDVYETDRYIFMKVFRILFFIR